MRLLAKFHGAQLKRPFSNRWGWPWKISRRRCWFIGQSRNCSENKIVGQALRLPEALALQPQMTEQLPAMSAQLEYLNSQIKQAVADGQLMESTAKNIGTLLSGARTDLYFRSVNELFSWAQWSELNDRFYQTIAF